MTTYQDLLTKLDEYREDISDPTNGEVPQWEARYGSIGIEGGEVDGQRGSDLLLIMPDYPDSTCDEIGYIVMLHNNWSLIREALRQAAEREGNAP